MIVVVVGLVAAAVVGGCLGWSALLSQVLVEQALVVLVLLPAFVLRKQQSQATKQMHGGQQARHSPSKNHIVKSKELQTLKIKTGSGFCCLIAYCCYFLS